MDWTYLDADEDTDYKFVWYNHLRLCFASHLLSPTARERGSEPTITMKGFGYLRGVSFAFALRDNYVNRVSAAIPKFRLTRPEDGEPSQA
jgi:hypothetical protein